MSHINITVSKPKKLYSQQKGISPIEYYLQKIKYIKNQPNTQSQQCKKHTHYNTHSNLTLSFVESKTNQSVLNERRKSYQKKRSLSMRTDIESYSYGKSEIHKINAKTLYGNNKFQASHYNVSQLSVNQDSKARLKTASSFKVKPESRNLFGENKLSLTRTRISTQTPENNEKLITQQQFLEEDSDAKQTEQTAKNIENVKNDILFKISSYVQKLDEKGEEELNQMLVGNYKRNIRCHSDIVFFQAKIQQMIRTNKQIVNMLKQELLCPDNKSQFSQRRNSVSPKNKTILQQIVISPSKKIIVEELQVDCSSLQVPQKTKAQHKRKPTTLYDSQQSRLNQQIKLSQQLQQQSHQDQFDYENQINHVTNEFSSEWQKSQTHKKEIYQKFRKTLLKKFPAYRERQQKLKGKNHKKENKQEEDFFEQDNIFDSSFPIEIHTQKTMKQGKPAKIQYKHQGKKQSLIQEKPQRKKKLSKQLSLLPNQHLNLQHLTKLNSSIKQIEQSQQFKQTNNKLSISLSKVTLLSNRNSISKGSTKTLSILGSQNKQEVSKFNFQNVVEFIFKRAYFYSVSKKRIIQNKTRFIELPTAPQIEKKKPDISFITYNSKAQQRKYLRTTKLNQKKLRATGNFLVKNKFNIMEIQKEGHRGHQFLRKCLEDAIEDYLNRTKTK